MDMNSNIWHPKLTALLLRHGYRLNDPETHHDIQSRCSLSSGEVEKVLAGESSASIEAIIRIAGMLHFPVGALFDGSSEFRIYPINGGVPITVTVPLAVPHQLEDTEIGGLIFVDGTDGSYADIGPDDMVICTKNFGVLEINKVYLLEDDRSRYLRRCAGVNLTTCSATMASDAEPGSIEVFYDEARLVTVNSPMVMGRVLWTFKTY